MLSKFASVALLGCGLFIDVSGCAKHGDFIEIKEQVGNLGRAQEQLQKRQDALQRHVEGGKAGFTEQAVSRGPDPVIHQRVQELTSRVNELEGRLSRMENVASQATVKTEESMRPSKSAHVPEPQEASPFIQGTPSISPTSAFNLAYNDYLNGRYDLAVSGFQRFLKDFPSTSLAPNAHYWIGESYFSLKDHVRATQAFQRVIGEFRGSEKVAPALFKLGLTAMEMGDSQAARKHFKRVIEESPTSDEAKLAKNKLAEIR